VASGARIDRTAGLFTKHLHVKSYCRLWTSALIYAAPLALAAEPVDTINPLSGTNGDTEFSRGNTVPAIVAPFGMTTWAPQTDGSASPFYQMKHRQWEGIRATHQPSVWVRDYGDFLVTPLVGEWRGTQKSRASAFCHEKETAKAYYYSAWLDRYETKVELVPTERCSLMRFTFPSRTRRRWCSTTKATWKSSIPRERRSGGRPAM
jgi:putative alpha-1,2-mannosidase